MEKEGSGWGEANDILTYVQSKVSYTVSATCAPQCCTVACLWYILCSAKNENVQQYNYLLRELMERLPNWHLIDRSPSCSSDRTATSQNINVRKTSIHPPEIKQGRNQHHCYLTNVMGSVQQSLRDAWRHAGTAGHIALFPALPGAWCAC